IRCDSQGCARSAARRGHGTNIAAFTPGRSTRSTSGHETARRNTAGPSIRAQLDAFYERAQQVCGLGPFAYDAKTWEAQGYGAPLPLDPKLVNSVIFQFGKRSKFDRYEDDFARAENVNLVLHATAVHLADSGGRVVRIDCATLSGNRFGVRARTFVLAAGAIE